LVGECSQGNEAVEVLRRERPDLVFLDVQMPGLTGVQVLEALGDSAPPAVVFVTAHEQFAVEAFEVQAVDYLLKPVSR
jgi:two-component system LytT family response regulator